ncbi:snoRNA-binding rRNA-processing protein [Borealophlyctis nickersoniae]|nr:snoRNA-binding rRNA-processing protein [Borealophlyctis nickersoniae]
MSTGEYRQVQIKKFPRAAGRKTAEARYWRKFKSPVLIKEYAAVSSIHFSPVAPYDFAVTSSTRVQVYGTATSSVKKSISRFKDTAYSGCIRGDGKLLVAGDATGLVQLFDLNSRAILRTLSGHDGAVHVTRFSPDQNQILSAGDDRTVRIWDVPTQTPAALFNEHEDYVRAGLVSSDNCNLVLSGSYDHTVKLWDLRAKGCMMTMHHEFPVEALLMYPGGGLVASAGGNQVKIWDILGGGRLLQTLSNHQKTITCMAFDGSGSRILTGSLDHHVKVYNLQDYKVTHSVKYPAPVQSLAVSPNDTHMVVGMTTGLLSIRQRVVKTEELIAQQQAKAQLRRGTYKYFIRGQNVGPSKDDIRIESRRKARLQPYDKFLKSFQYANALDAAIMGGAGPVIVVSLLEELIHRNGLRIAVGGRDDRGLEPVTQFLWKYISHPRYTTLLIDVANVVLDLYANVAGQSPIIAETMHKLREKVLQEIRLQERLQEVLGLMDAIFSVSR